MGPAHHGRIHHNASRALNKSILDFSETESEKRTPH